MFSEKKAIFDIEVRAESIRIAFGYMGNLQMPTIFNAFDLADAIEIYIKTGVKQKREAP
jgi:hypothetical protein